MQNFLVFKFHSYIFKIDVKNSRNSQTQKTVSVSIETNNSYTKREPS